MFLSNSGIECKYSHGGNQRNHNVNLNHTVIITVNLLRKLTKLLKLRKIDKDRGQEVSEHRMTFGDPW